MKEIKIDNYVIRETKNTMIISLDKKGFNTIVLKTGSKLKGLIDATINDINMEVKEPNYNPKEVLSLILTTLQAGMTLLCGNKAPAYLNSVYSILKEDVPASKEVSKEEEQKILEEDETLTLAQKELSNNNLKK